MSDFELIYRINNDQLIICDFRATEASHSQRAVAGFIKLIHQLEIHLPALALVRGIILDSGHEEVKTTRQRLGDALIYQGASWQDIEDETWLVYTMASHRH